VLLLTQQKGVQPACETDEARCLPHRDEGSGDVWLGRFAGVVANREALVGQAEDHLRGDDEARKAQRVDLRPGDVVPLGHATSRPLEVTVNETVFAHAVPGNQGARLACLVVPSPKETSPKEAGRR